MKFVWTDGGRAAAGYKGTTARDCVVRAGAIASGRPYQEVYDLVNKLAVRERPRKKYSRSSARAGVKKKTMDRVMSELGGVWTPSMRIDWRNTNLDELPGGRLVVVIPKHIVAIIDGVIHDTFDLSRDGTHCVFGFWRFA